ncbi:MAG: tetratricopeptide repeat protein [Bacteroidia bacterium]
MNKTLRLENILNMLKTEPNDLFLNYSLGIEYIAINKYSEAIIQFNKSLTINPNYFTAYYQLGKVYEILNDFNMAITQYQQGLKIATLQKNNKAINEFNEAIFLIED